MKKKTFIFMAAILLMLAGCTRNTKDYSEYSVYYGNESGTALRTDRYTPVSADTLDNIKDIWVRMHDSITASELYSLIPEGLEMTEIDLTDGQLTMTFNENYHAMDNVTEVLLRAGLVEAATQFAEVKKVVFHIGNDVLKNHAGDPVGPMNRSTFINNPVGINSYQYASLTLYFSDFLGESVVKEMRNVHYSSNTTLEKVVMEQLISGPMNKQLNPVFTPDVKVLGITVENKTCTVNLSEAFLNETDRALSAEVQIYAIVNTLCDVLPIDKVQFQIEGSSDVMFRGELSFEGPFHRRSDIISVKNKMTPMETEAENEDPAEPSIGL